MVLAMLTLKVKNWEKYQHYKDRNPPWIKLHFELLTSADWVPLWYLFYKLSKPLKKDDEYED